jgi:hypothetical protein
LPIVLFNTAVALIIIWAVWRLFGRRVALVGGLLIALDPFYLSDSRVNRAEAVITGLMTLSVLALIFYYQRRQLRFVFISGLLGGLSFLTKIQALSILPVVALTGLLIDLDSDGWQDNKTKARSTPNLLISLLRFGLVWALAAGLIWWFLWPSMWVTPLETLALVFNYTTRKVGAEGVSLFFLGQTYQDADPGFFFYPLVFLMRITPLALIGLLGTMLRFIFTAVGRWRKYQVSSSRSEFDDPFSRRGSFILVIYVLLYAAVMTVGSHKQDRYLMPVFLGLDILAAMGLIYLWAWLRSRLGSRMREYEVEGVSAWPPFRRLPYAVLEGLLFVSLVIIQAATVLPHHPYYYSYFNPLFGGGQTAVNILRIGWGEGMDQVGAYLAAKPDSRNLVVSSRFGHNMLDFKGEVIALGSDGRWTQADYIVLYVQQVQRRLDPSPEYIDYFQARTPEKVVSLGGIEYAWIYPIPFTTPANPQVSVMPEQAALLGYSWNTPPLTGESANQLTGQPPPKPTNQPTIRLLWENLGKETNRRLAARLVGSTAGADWAVCTPDPAFAMQARTPGAFVESLCTPRLDDLSPDIYTVEFGLSVDNTVAPFLFPEGWQAALLTSTGTVTDVPALERFDAIAGEIVPPAAQPLDRVYDGKLRLLAYQMNPAQPRPGEVAELALYWQAVEEVLVPFHLTVQLADSRSLSLGRVDSTLTPPDHGEIGPRWLPGEVKTTRHELELPPQLDPPLAGRLEISLRDEAEVFLPPTDLKGGQLDPVAAYFTVAPVGWPALDNSTPVKAAWQNGITLRAYTLSPARPQPGESVRVSLFWQADRPVAEDYVAFVHLLDDTGHIEAQNDSLPRAGAYPTRWWLPAIVIEDTHPLLLPADLAAGGYQLAVGLYRAEDGRRLLLTDGRDHTLIGIKVQ